MGSFLNFIFEKTSKDKNGGDFCYRGQLSNKILNKFSFTENLEIRSDYKNILFYECSWHLPKLVDYILSSDKLVKLLKNKDVKLMISNLADPSWEHHINTTKTALKDVTDDIIFLDVNRDLSDCYTFDYFLEEGVTDYKYFFDITNDLGYISKKIDVNELDTFRNKKFLSFNRILSRYHRLRLLIDYYENDFSDSYFSFINPIEFEKINNGDRVEDSYGIDYIRQIEDEIVPLELDTMNCTDKSGFRTSNTFKKDLFLDSCINIVTETTFDSNQAFISEKILKPIVSYQPFIVLGPVWYLARLREYGFKTFSDVWDESYDSVNDFEERYNMVSKLILDLNKKSIEELNEIYKSVKNICIHNMNVFLNLKTDSFDNNLKQIENEW